ncbi:MAG: penicillin-binding transpeptidase domain-containing protein [Oscillospiraceae bacterium]|nr:penicillin-binding transpeptidase domain-containing protein [Oscillospiraceae bacterium]
MKKVKRRTYSIFGLILAIGVLMTVFIFRLAADGEAWALFPSNPNVFRGGNLAVGAIYDRNDVPLFETTDHIPRFHPNENVRRATMHVVGDRGGNIGTGALHAFGRQLVGYNLITGTYSWDGAGNSLHLTIDAELSAVALGALGQRHGSVVVMNYETGDILVAVSSPTYDPQNPPTFGADNPAPTGIFLNRGLSSALVPGSVFKIVTAAIAMDTLDDAMSRTFNCTGALVVDGNRVTCMRAHGTVRMAEAMGHSCNGFFAQLALDLGAPQMRREMERFGLISTHAVDGLPVAAGNFGDAERGSAALAWAGVGQGENLLNPLSTARFLGAIPRGGTPIEPRLIDNFTGNLLPWSAGPTVGEQIMDPRVAVDLVTLLRNTAINYYGNTFPNLAVAGKTGTAEVGEGRRPHSWFIGFLDDPANPLAFVVVVENGGFGIEAAAPVVNTVLQAAVRR